MSFQTALVHVLRQEGGYVDDPLDRGGATNQGITQATYDEWRTFSKRQPLASVRYITPAEVSAIYQQRYWLTGKCGLLRDRTAFAHFDACVNHGPRQAAKLLQRAAGVVEDGAIGPATLGAINTTPEDRFLAVLLMERRAFYERIVRNDATQERFLNGWAKRLRHLAVAVWV